MAKALGLVVAIVVAKVVVVFGAPVVGQLKHGFAAEGVGGAVGVVLGHKASLTIIQVTQEIQGELHFGEVQFAHQAHAHHSGVEVHGALGFLYAHHGLVEYVAFGFGNGVFVQTGGLFEMLGHFGFPFFFAGFNYYTCVRFMKISRA